MSTVKGGSDGSYHFYMIAMEYYVSGRAALKCGNALITGNLLHHAVEMLLKGYLSKSIPMQELKRRFGHKLLDLWNAFKSLFSGEDLSEFDSMITDLERFEEIRYPDSLLQSGGSIGLGWGRGKPVETSSRPVPQYQVGLGDVDAFVARLVSLCALNPHTYVTSLSEEGWQMLTVNNSESRIWPNRL
jgi:hypothetical protein